MGQRVNISTARQGFNLKNSTSALSNFSAHVEVTVDYSDYNATEFTFMLDTPNTGAASFYIPLINETGIKEMNIYSQMYAPKRIGERTPSEILSNNNITLSTFNPGDIEGQINESNIFVGLFFSNSTCDVPNPPAGCDIGAFGPDENEPREGFDPLSVVMGGGKLSFRMGYSGIMVHYVNVDMLASGPPDAMFDDSVTETSDNGFNAALRFGSQGPTIYDYVLISIPYTKGSSSQTGLDDSSQVNISIPLLYDESWNIIWNTTANGTNATLLAGNYSHFSAKASEWQTLMNNNTCITNQSALSTTNPCYIDTTNHRIWLRIPHFSGVEPSVIGSLITATVSSTTTSTTNGGIASSSKNWSKQKIHSWIKITPGKAAIMKDFDKEFGIKEIQIEVKNEAQNVKMTVRKYDSKPAQVSVEKSGKVYRYLEIKGENLEDKLNKAMITIQVEKNWVSENNLSKENISLFKYNETSQEWRELPTTLSEEDDNYYYYETELTSFSYFAIGEKVLEQPSLPEEKKPMMGEEITKVVKKNLYLWIVIGIIFVIFIIVIAVILVKRKKQMPE